MASPDNSNPPPAGGIQISSWSIRNPIPTVIFFLVMTIVGALGFSAMRINNWPDIDLPYVVVTVIRSGAAPQELQNQVTRIVEDSVSGLGGVRHIQSTVNEGASTSVIEFTLDTDLEKATNDVRNAVAGVRGNLPSDVQDPIISRVDNAAGGSLLTYTIRAANMSPEQLSWFVDNNVSKTVLSVKGVSQLNRDGGVDREIKVELDPAKLAAQGVTASDISNTLRSFNVNMPGGRFNSGGMEQNIRTVGEADTVAELSNMRVTLSNGRSIRVGDVANVTDSWDEPRTRARFNGDEVVGFNVQRTRGTSEVAVAKGVRAAIAQLQKDNPNVQINEVASSVADVQRSYDTSFEALVIGAILAVIVVYLFLRDIRATLVSAVAMPMSLLPTFFVMHATNQSFNVVSLLALSLTVGILVDDAIVEIENIVRHMREGKAPYPAAIEAADEIGLAVVATTATLVAVFAPTGFMPGIVGQFFKSFAIAACVSVIFSLVVARTLTPLMGAYFLRTNKRHENDEPFWMKDYQKLLRWCLTDYVKWRWNILLHGVVIATAAAIMALTTGTTMPAIIGVAALVVAGLLAIVLRKPNMKARWAVLEFGLLLTLLFAGPGFGMLMGPQMMAAKEAAPHGKAAVQAAMHAAALLPNPMAVPGMVMAVIAAILLLGTLFLTIRMTKSYLTKPWAVIILGIFFFAGSIALLQTIPSDNIPASDTAMSVLSLSSPPGTTLDQTDANVERITAELRKRPEVTSVYATENMETASFIVNLVPIAKRKLSQAQFEQDFSKQLKTYPGVRASFGQQGGGGTGVAYILVGDDGDQLTKASVRLQQEMASLKELTNVGSQDNLAQPEIEITPKADEAARMGVSTTSISSAARVATMGDIDQILAKFNDGDRQVPIRVLLKQDARYDVNNLNTLMVPTANGTSVPLTAVADVSFGAGPIAIHRQDRTRSATVTADLNGVPTGVADAAVQNLPVMKDIKAGKYATVHTAVNPNTEDFVEMVPNFIVAILTGIMLMYIVLVLLFGSFSHPFTIILALPLCFGGAFVALILCHMSMSMPSLIGLIMLTGIAAKNSILLVEYAMVSMKKGLSRFDALMEAAHKRARPILMTTVAMGAGMLPVAIGHDSFRQPMAVAVIGGLITSTLLSLVFVPAAYTLIDRFSNWLGSKIHLDAQGKPEDTPGHPAE